MFTSLLDIPENEYNKSALNMKSSKKRTIEDRVQDGFQITRSNHSTFDMSSFV